MEEEEEPLTQDAVVLPTLSRRGCIVLREGSPSVMSQVANNVRFKKRKVTRSYRSRRKRTSMVTSRREDGFRMEIDDDSTGEDNDSYVSGDGGSTVMIEREITINTTSSEYDTESKHHHEETKKFYFSKSQLKLQLEKRLTMCGHDNGLPQAVGTDDQQLFEDLLPQAVEFEKENALLTASLIGSPGMMERLIDTGTRVSIKDSSGRTALHLAASAGNAECLQLLIKNGASVNQWDDKLESTPLMCAASAKSVKCVNILLEAGAEIDAGLSHDNQSALLWAVRAGSVECTEILLRNNAQVNSTAMFTEGPIHVAASEGDDRILKLLLQHRASTNLARDRYKMMPLHIAAEDGETKCVKLLLEAGASVRDKTFRMRTALHLACAVQAPDCVSLLLKAKADPNAQDMDDRTPLHCAIAKSSRNLECVKILLEHGADPNKKDHSGFTPIHLAALHENSACVKLLMDKGADITIKNNAGITALNFILRKTPDMINNITRIFDRAISLSDEANDRELHLKMDFRVLVPGRKNESHYLMCLLLEGQKQFLHHPLCQSFLHMKWNKVRKFFLFHLLLFFLFVLMITVYTMNVFTNECLTPDGYCSTHNATSNDTVQKCQEYIENMPSWGYVSSVGMQCQWFILLMTTILMVVRELLELFLYAQSYLHHTENYIQWMIIVHVFLICDVDPNDKCIKEWQYHVAAIGILITWAEMMLMVGRLPMFGIYVQMFTHVALDFGKFLFAYMSLIIAFFFCFCIMFPEFQSFSLTSAGLRTLVMMSGEYEYDGMFHDPEHPIRFTGTTQFLFVVFILFVSIVLMNLLVGLAVNDISGLRKTAKLERLRRQAELIAHIEGILFCRVIDWMPRRIEKCLHDHALLVPSSYRWSIFFRPNDPRETRISRDIMNAAVKLAKGNVRRRTSSVLKKIARRKTSTNSWMNQDHMDDSALDRLEESVCGLSTNAGQMQTRMTYLESRIENLEGELKNILKEISGIAEILKKNNSNT